MNIQLNTYRLLLQPLNNLNHTKMKYLYTNYNITELNDKIIHDTMDSIDSYPYQFHYILFCIILICIAYSNYIEIRQISAYHLANQKRNM